VFKICDAKINVILKFPNSNNLTQSIQSLNFCRLQTVVYIELCQSTSKIEFLTLLLFEAPYNLQNVKVLISADFFESIQFFSSSPNL